MVSYPYTCYNYPPPSQISLYGQPFLDYSPFETRASNDPKMTLNTKRSKVLPYMLQLSSPVPNFTLLPAAFELQDTSEPNDLKWPWTLKGQWYAIYFLQLPPSPILLCFALPPTVLELPLNKPQIALNTKRSKVPLIHVTTAYGTLRNVTQRNATSRGATPVAPPYFNILFN